VGFVHAPFKDDRSKVYPDQEANLSPHPRGQTVDPMDVQEN